MTTIIALSGRQVRAARAAVVMMATAAGLAACGASTVTDGARTARIEVEPSNVQVGAGADVALSAVLRDDAGNTLASKPVFWSSSDTSVATVSSSGVVSARSPGLANIAASALGMSATAAVTVVSTATITVSPATASSNVGAIVQLTARDAQGATLGLGRVTWVSSDARIALVSSTGAVAALRKGTVTITATNGSASATARITVK